MQKNYVQLRIYRNGLLVSLILVLFCTKSVFSQITVIENSNAQLMVESIMGKGYTVTNPKLTCPANAIGTFVSTTSNIGLGKGIVLTTGSIDSVKGPNDTPSASMENGGPGDAQLDALAGFETLDACVLEFDLTPSCDELKINYVFASEEYPDFVGSDYNDVFGFFISGPGINGIVNMATIPNSSTPVTINNVNANTNSQYFVNNDNGQTIEYNGFTKPLISTVKVIPCSNYHLKLAIADAQDAFYDSGVFVEAGSINCISPEIKLPPACANEAMISLCAPAGYIYEWPAGQPGSVPPFDQQCLHVNNPQAGDVYTVKLTPAGGGCSTTSTITLKGADFIIRDTAVCKGTSKFTLLATPLVNGNYTFKWEPAINLSCTDCADPVFDPVSTQTYTVTMIDKDVSNCNRVKTVTIKVGEQPTVNVNDITICMGTVAKLNGTISNGNQAIWVGGTGIFDPDRNTVNATYKPSAAEENAGSVMLTLESEDPPGPCEKASKSLTLTIVPAAIVDAGADQHICEGSTIQLNATLLGSSTVGMWTAGAGIYKPNRVDPKAIYIPDQAEIAAGKIKLIFMSSDSSSTCPRVADSMIVAIDKKTFVSAGDPIAICESNTIKLSGIISGGTNEGNWSGGMGVYNKSNTDLKAVYQPTADEIKAGKVVFTLTSNATGACPVAFAEVTHTINPNPVIAFSTINPRDCLPHCIDFNDSTTAGNTAITKWEWDFGNGKTGNDQHPGKICFSKPGSYTVKLKATSDKNCVSTLIKEKMIETYKNPVAQFLVHPNPASVLEPNIHFYDQSIDHIKLWNWDFGDGMINSGNNPNPLHMYSAEIPDIYIVQLAVTDTNGCKDSITKEVEIKPYFAFYIPNAFTPDDNGLNDVFLGNGVGIKEYSMWIFDRWGNLIFESTDISKGWNGKLKNSGEASLMDVFVWKVEIKDIFGKSHTYAGTVTIAK